MKDGKRTRDVVTVTDRVRGIGTVLEQSQRGPKERNELVSVRR